MILSRLGDFFFFFLCFKVATKAKYVQGFRVLWSGASGLRVDGLQGPGNLTSEGFCGNFSGLGQVRKCWGFEASCSEVGLRRV